MKLGKEDIITLIVFTTLVSLFLLWVVVAVDNDNKRINHHAVIDGLIYPWSQVSCVSGVAYLNNYSNDMKTVMLGLDGKPKPCHNVKMTKDEFNNLGDK